MSANLDRILGIELLCAAQVIEFRAPLLTSAPLPQVIARRRQDVATLTEDRYLAPDLEAVATLIAGGEIAAASQPLPELAP